MDLATKVIDLLVSEHATVAEARSAMGIAAELARHQGNVKLDREANVYLLPVDAYDVTLRGKEEEA
jgi:hypothetical protein